MPLIRLTLFAAAGVCALSQGSTTGCVGSLAYGAFFQERLHLHEEDVAELSRLVDEQQLASIANDGEVLLSAPDVFHQRLLERTAHGTPNDAVRTLFPQVKSHQWKWLIPAIKAVNAGETPRNVQAWRERLAAAMTDDALSQYLEIQDRLDSEADAAPAAENESESEGQEKGIDRGTRPAWLDSFSARALNPKHFEAFLTELNGKYKSSRKRVMRSLEELETTGKASNAHGSAIYHGIHELVFIHSHLRILFGKEKGRPRFILAHFNAKAGAYGGRRQDSLFDHALSLWNAHTPLE